jgi:hypothetical protein
MSDKSLGLRGRYNMLRAATLNMVGINDNLQTLKQLAETMRVPAITDPDMKANLTLVQALVVTHEDYKP